MFERYTDRARRVIVLAQEEARLLNHGYIGTEHLLLGLLHEGEGVAAQALVSSGVTVATARTKVEELIGRGENPPSGHIPFTPRAKKVLELGLREALQVAASYIGPEHLLLGLLREGGGIGAHVLTVLGVDLDRLRERVLKMLPDKPEPQRPTGLIPGAVLQLTEAELAGCTRNQVALFEPTGRRLSALLDGNRLLLTIYDRDGRRYIRLDAAQAESLREWLAGVVKEQTTDDQDSTPTENT